MGTPCQGNCKSSPQCPDQSWAARTLATESTGVLPNPSPQLPHASSPSVPDPSGSGRRLAYALSAEGWLVRVFCTFRGSKQHMGWHLLSDDMTDRDGARRYSHSRKPASSNSEHCCLQKTEKVSAPRPSQAVFLLKEPSHGEERDAGLSWQLRATSWVSFLPPPSMMRNANSSLVHFSFLPLHKVLHHLLCCPPPRHTHTARKRVCCGLQFPVTMCLYLATSHSFSPRFYREFFFRREI